ncbi:hypothetical protein [Paramuribaculum intestinale]|uniref:hypothetical protein n=1 Tax=Paramuribaculum intestinale TaxID=2094151 RepID=UPI0025AA0D7B|nr:hypothetical protein [Paramuribaculum intestinale]
MTWLFIVIGLIALFVLLMIISSKAEKKEAAKLGISIEEYRSQQQAKLAEERKQRKKEKEENESYKAKYGMSKAQYLEFAKISEEYRKKGISLNEQFQTDLINRFPHLGKPTVEICFHKHLLQGDKGMITRAQYFEYGWTCNSITIWEDKKTFLILGDNNRVHSNPFPESIQKPLPFNTLVSCEAIDDAKIIHGTGLSTTKTSKLGMITRGAAGGVLLGGVGALAGALTANTSTETIFEADTIQHNYKIHLTLNDFSCPLLTLEFGNGEMQMRQVLSVLNLIIKNS